MGNFLLSWASTSIPFKFDAVGHDFVFFSGSWAFPNSEYKPCKKSAPQQLAQILSRWVVREVGCTKQTTVRLSWIWMV